MYTICKTRRFRGLPDIKSVLDLQHHVKLVPHYSGMKITGDVGDSVEPQFSGLWGANESWGMKQNAAISTTTATANATATARQR